MDNDILDIAVQAIAETMLKGTPPQHLPDILANHEGLNRLFSDIAALQQSAREIAGGNLDQTISMKGIMAGALKSLQAALRHLTWQTQQIASGDFGHSVDFMGNFSEAFNTMVKSLADAKVRIEQREADLREAYNELQRAKITAEAASRVKSEFLANISHEIRTPLNAIIGFTNLAMSEKPGPKQRDYMKSTLHASNLLLEIFNDILDFAKIEAGHTKLENIDFIMNDVIQHISKAVRLRIIEKNLNFRYEIAEDIPSVLIGDPMKLTQILKHLINNAIKFTEKGKVVVRVQNATCKTQNKSPESDHNFAFCMLRFEIEDTGVGIPADKLPLLFHAFTQVDGSTTRKFGGTGLGLVISKRLIEMMGGEISVKSEPDQGSIFSFTAKFGMKEFSYSMRASDYLHEITSDRHEISEERTSPDISKIEPLLSELAVLLNAGDFDAIEYMDTIRKELAESVSKEQLMALETYVHEYEFDKASDVLSKIRSSVTHPSIFV